MKGRVLALAAAAAATAGLALASWADPATAIRIFAPAALDVPVAEATGTPLVVFTGALVDREGTGVTLRFLASGANPCVGTGTRTFVANASDSANSARVWLTERYSGPPAQLPAGAECMIVLSSSPHQVTLSLAQPLGSRELLGPDGIAIPVTRA